ncbi:hypothetical protein [Pedosphaera parvula]|uniref:Uncharacterized protein n=1 Tax=Pedosphaera parvula (strain Ellin514) TaxID=320771 RepID=B9XKU2_PEDPL|nr:hypothetical protein [Pedosphaera parvula]EEF59585.1 conserved hypothetical protein [Pedosphaera parvula Ellin514]
MILIFENDSTTRAVDDISEANRYCEVIDVEDGVYTFIDERAAVLRPILASPTRRTMFGILCSPDSFSLAATDEHRPELLRSIFDDTVSVEPGPRIHTREDLIRELDICKR